MAELDPLILDAKQFDGSELRRFLTFFQEGALGAGDVKVVQRAAGANHSVDVAAGKVVVTGDTGDQGNYVCTNNAVLNSDAFFAGAITPGHASLPRIDQIIARVRDHAIDGSGRTDWKLEVLTGTATSGTTLATRTGAAALPSGACRLADVLVPSGAATSIPDANIRDRRPWARGVRWANSATYGANYVTTGGAYVSIDASLFKRRFEFAANIVEVGFSAVVAQLGLDGGWIGLFKDDVFVEGSNMFDEVSDGGYHPWDLTWHLGADGVSVAGSHTLEVKYHASGVEAGFRIARDASQFAVPRMSVIERVGGSSAAHNGLT